MGEINSVVASVEKIMPEAAILSTGSQPETLHDLLVLGKSPQEVALSSLRKRLTTIDRNSHICDDAVILPSYNTGIAYYDREFYEALVEKISNGVETDPVIKPWSVGPWLPEAFAYDVDHSLIIAKGPTDINIKAFSPYPTAMREAIMARTTQEIDIKTSLLEQSSGLAITVLQSDIALAGLRHIHAQARVFFRGLKYLDSTRLQLDYLSNQKINSLFSTFTDSQL